MTYNIYCCDYCGRQVEWNEVETINVPVPPYRRTGGQVVNQYAICCNCAKKMITKCEEWNNRTREPIEDCCTRNMDKKSGADDGK